MSKNKSIIGMFSNFKSLILLPDISKWKFSNLESIGDDYYLDGLFSGCSSLVSLPDIYKWNMSKVKDMRYAFTYCMFINIFT